MLVFFPSLSENIKAFRNSIHSAVQRRNGLIRCISFSPLYLYASIHSRCCGVCALGGAVLMQYGSGFPLFSGVMHTVSASFERFLREAFFYTKKRMVQIIRFRTCPHRVNVRIFRHNFVGGKAKIRRRAVALQGFLTKSPAKFDEKTCMNPYVDRFLFRYSLAR